MKALLFTVLPFLIASCGVYAWYPYVTRDFELGKPKEATVGSVMIGWETGSDYMQYEKWLVDRKGLRKELIYNGLIQGILQVSYREFAVDVRGAYARPAFNQELKYELANSPEITFQDVRIRIESADQSKVVFVLLQEPTETKIDTSAAKK